jgi:[acyl-carrier-protein] S-malonyltransferase
MTSGTVIFMFPGQSSRHPKMIENILREWPQAAKFVAQASDVLGRDLASFYQPDNRAMFARNQDVQIGVFLANYLHMKRLEQSGVVARWSLGLSLGEYNHLVHIGALSFDVALKLLDQRGMLFDQGATGVMTSVFPVEANVLETQIAALGLGERVVIGVYNTPRQHVLSGERGAVTRVVAALEEETLIQAVEIESNIPIHSPVFALVAERFADVLTQAHFMPTQRPYVPNVKGSPIAGATPDQIRGSLAAHVSQPVRWRFSVERLAADLPDSEFVEVGPGAVLYNSFGRGWMPGRRSKSDISRDSRVCSSALTADFRHVP